MRARDDAEDARLGNTAPGPAPALVSGGDLSPGYVVGEYRVEQVIGRGGMGVVYSGLQPVIEKRVAIKVLNSELSSDPALVRRFLDEARAVNRIRHPNIIDIFSFGQLADCRQYFVMEYLEGHTLADRLQSGDLPLDQLPPLLGQICDALDAAHGEHIVHRDLKPENIWIVEPRRGRPFVKLLDFGIAKLLATGEQTTTQAGVLMGTPQYMSPEQCHGRSVDHRTDLYAMGVILYQTYAGTLPFRGEGFAEILTKQLTQVPERPSTHAALPQALDALIMRCLAKEPADRPQSARELGEELARILVPRTIRAAQSILEPTATTTLRGSAQSSESPAASHAPRKRWPIAVAMLAVGLLSALGAVRLARGPQGTPIVAGPAPSPKKAETKVAVAPAPTSGPSALPAVVTLPPPPVQEPTKKLLDETKPKKAKSLSKLGARDSSRESGARRASPSGLVTDNPFR
ncbi:MAG TPA: protein kinase [Polyangia bacterium]